LRRPPIPPPSSQGPKKLPASANPVRNRTYTQCDASCVLFEIRVSRKSPCTVSSASTSQGDTSIMKVWIDQDLCTGDGLCEEIAPDVFTLLDDGLAYVKEGDKVFSDPGGAEGLANVPAGQEEAVIEAAEECPGECIFIEVD